MNHQAYIENYQNDLLNSKKTPLLIELTQDDIKRLNHGNNKSQQNSLPVLIAQNIYNQEQGDNVNNMIVIDGDTATSQEHFELLEALLEQLRHELKSIKNLTTLKESLKAAASVATGGLLNDFIGDQLDKGLSFLFDEISDNFTALLTDIATDKIDISKSILANVEDLLHNNAGNRLGDVFANINQQQLHLTTAAKAELDILSSTFSKSQNIDVFQLTFKLLLAVALDSPKLIYINNPHKLDDNSIALISLLFSFAKAQKDQEKHIGLSVLYTYTDENFHLYHDVPEALKSKQQLLVSQRRFVQRYAMLENPSSDIPTIAVKSSVFIGRKKETEWLNTQFKNRKKNTLSIISGEPGIGKTALVNQHLANIQKQTNAIVLSLFNESGHSSQNTGLSSLEKSILDEAKRLELLISWKDKGVNFIKNIGTKDNAIKAIGAIFSGADKALSIAEAGYQRVMVDNHVDHIKQSSVGDLNNKQEDDKQRQFNNIDKAIDKLKSISTESLPLVLFIDDIQWIDDTASEYILTHLVKQPGLYIVTTLRPSDAATILKEQLTRPALNTYSLSLLKACNVEGSEEFDNNEFINALTSQNITLSGFDKQTLTELIAKVIQGEESQHTSLANAVFNTLAGADANDVNTLFAVETINMLCDKKLYSENSFERLILDAPFRFNPQVKNIENHIEKTFSLLQNKYKDSLSHANQSINGQQFNLMAYAVLEERLHLLKVYLGEQGNAAVNTLLFSSLLGAPFSSEVVKKVIHAITQSEDSALSPLRSHLIGKEGDAHLHSEHYTIIDEVYEILRRLPSVNDQYQYRHGLLHTFLDKQFDYLLEYVFIDNTLDAKNALITLIFNTIQSCLESLDGYDKPLYALTKEQISTRLFFQNAEVNILAKGFGYLPDAWAKDYTSCVNSFASSYTNNNQVRKAIILHEKALAICEHYFHQLPDSWAENYATNLSELAISYVNNNQVDDAIRLQEKTMTIRERYYLQSPDNCTENYIVSLNNLASSYKENNQLNEAIELEEKALTICERYYQQSPASWSNSFAMLLINLASSYKKNNQLSEGIALEEKALAIREHYYQQKPDSWANRYTTSLNNLAFSYEQNNQLNEAIALEEKALVICERYYHQSPDSWAKGYITSLTNLTLFYRQNNQLSEAITLGEQGLAMCERYYHQSPDSWAKDCAICLNNLAVCYKQNNQLSEATVLEEKALAIREHYYHQSPDSWSEDYAASLNNLASSYKHNKQLSEAKVLEEKALTICERYYHQSPNSWAQYYVSNLNNLADSYKQNSQLSEAIALEKKALVICERYYHQSPNSWASTYAANLNNIASSYKQNNQLNEAIVLEGKSLEIHERYHQQSPDYWAEDYVVSLNDLAGSYKQNNLLNEAIALEEKALAICERYYPLSPDSWAKGFTIILNNLISSYKQNNQLNEVIALEEKALTICERYYHLSPDGWTEDYTTILFDLAWSYAEVKQFKASLDLFNKRKYIFKGLHQESPLVSLSDYLLSIDNVASANFRLQNYTEAEKHFKDYFELYFFEAFDDVEDCIYFIYPFVKYVQTASKVANFKPDEFVEMASQFAKEMTGKFAQDYKNQLSTLLMGNEELPGYIELSESDDLLDREKYQIFKQYFL